jgi:hypothetical protein
MNGEDSMRERVKGHSSDGVLRNKTKIQFRGVMESGLAMPAMLREADPCKKGKKEKSYQ